MAIFNLKSDEETLMNRRISYFQISVFTGQLAQNFTGLLYLRIN